MRHEARIDQLRRIRAEENRDIVDAAFYALAAIPPDRRRYLVEKWNHTFGGKRANPINMTWEAAQ